MATNAAFGPQGSTVLVGVTAVQVPGVGSNIPVTYRVRCLVAAYLTWGGSGVTAVGAPSAGTPSANTIGMPTGQTEVFTLSWQGPIFFISTVAASFEITPGEGM